MNPEELMKIAYDVAKRSPERTQNGAVVMSPAGEWSTGYNVNLWPEHSCYEFTVHAEEDAILQYPLRLELPECILVCPWLACSDCARKIVRAGIGTVWRHKDRTCEELSFEWWQTIQDADEFLQDRGVKINEIEGPIEGAKDITIRGRVWSPSTVNWKEES
jgi:deoxycytidylate deaminase